MAIKYKDVHEEKQHRGYRCYDGQQLLLFDFDEPFVKRDPISQTEQAYLDKEKQIASFIRSGELLQNFRRGDFDYPDGEVPDDAVPDPTMALGFDLADYSALKKKLEEDYFLSRRIEGETDPSKDEAAQQPKSETSEPEIKA